ncbi:hypothetical protein KFL_005040040 [Klebsormidium nitens]|uniref:Uncharacterized protein n=1 Tax=Klebsormidium nitens TaxID=105231 RepID=A0A1Y1IEA4_KLENI|nr:hypothetical protein KFL_005040040 [Klebsormidium nitens]|eukprot:GAQ89260.1 hypothetical protein KFL_005040040 [Klebsormidium nitens]
MKVQGQLHHWQIADGRRQTSAPASLTEGTRLERRSNWAALEARPRWAHWDESLRSDVHFRSFATKEATRGSIKWPPQWNSSPIVDPQGPLAGVRERARSAPPERNRERGERKAERGSVVPRWDNSVETSIRERTGKAKLKVTLPKYAEPFRPKSAPRPSRTEVPRSKTPVSRSWEGPFSSEPAAPAATGRHARAVRTRPRALAPGDLRASAEMFRTVRRRSQSPTFPRGGMQSAGHEKEVLGRARNAGCSRPVSKGGLRARQQSASADHMPDFDYGKGTRRAARKDDTRSGSERAGRRRQDSVSTPRASVVQDVAAAADAALAKALSLLRQSAPPPAALTRPKTAPLNRTPVISTDLDPPTSAKVKTSVSSRADRLAAARPRSNLSRQALPAVDDPPGTIAPNSHSHNEHGRKLRASDTPSMITPKPAGLVRRVVASTGEGAADCFGLDRASEWTSAAASGSAVCLVELARGETTGVFVKLVVTDRERALGGVRFAHAADLTDALEEVGYGDIRFHAKDNPSPANPVVRTFKLGAKTAIGRYLSVTLYPRHSSLADTQSDISVQRIYVGRGDPALLSESVLMRKPEKKLRMVGSFRHVFVEETGKENREEGSQGQISGADVPVAVDGSWNAPVAFDGPGDVPVAFDESVDSLTQAQTAEPGAAVAGIDSARQSGYRASNESNNGTSLAPGELFRVSEFGDRSKRASAADASGYSTRLVAVKNNPGSATERVASPGPDQLEEWLAGALRFDRPSLEERMPAYVPVADSEAATYEGPNTGDGRLDEEEAGEEIVEEEVRSQDESQKLDEEWNDILTGEALDDPAAGAGISDRADGVDEC